MYMFVGIHIYWFVNIIKDQFIYGDNSGGDGFIVYLHYKGSMYKWQFW